MRKHRPKVQTVSRPADGSPVRPAPGGAPAHAPARAGPEPARAGRAGRVVGLIATLAAAAFVTALAVRTVTSFDTGYHLAYGENFLDTGRIVQTNQFIYTRLDAESLSDPRNLGPGCWFDGTAYHFVNANWLSQVIMALAYRAGGMSGLSLMGASLVTAIVALLVLTMRSFRLPWHWAAAGLLLIGLTSYERFDLRPELFGYVVLVAQWLLLVRPELSRRRAAGAVALQVLAVNLHSYFLLGIALPGALLVDVALRWTWARTVTNSDAAALSSRLRLLAFTTAGMVLACLVNPWFLRGAIMPLQTLLYMRRHGISQWPVTHSSNPWAMISEFWPPFCPGFSGYYATTAFATVLALAGLAALCLLPRRRWGWLLVLAAFGLASFQTRRNVALGAIMLVPLSLIALTETWRAVVGRFPGTQAAKAVGGSPDPGSRLRRGMRLLERTSPLVVAAACLAAAAWLIPAVVGNRFYFSQGRSWRFGLGVSKLMLPVEAAEWINQHQPAGAVFCDFANSSNLMFLTNPHRDVPVLSNTWAEPPAFIYWAGQLCAAEMDFQPVADEYGVEVVALRFTEMIPPLIGRLAHSRDWVVVQLGAKHAMFLRRNGANAALARAAGLDEANFDADAFADRVSRSDPVPAYALHQAALLLEDIGWRGIVPVVWSRALDFDPDYRFALFGKPRALMRLALQRLRDADAVAADRPADAARMRQSAMRELDQARPALERLLALEPDHAGALGLMTELRQMRAARDGQPASQPR